MNRTEFLKVYKKFAGELMREGDNQFAYLEGNLVTAEMFSDWKLEGTTLTTDDSCDLEEIFDTYIDGTPDKWTEYGGNCPWCPKGTLVVLFYRKNTYTTQFDFYNNEITRGFDDLLESWQTEYWVATDKGLEELDVDDWNVN